eukprot:6188936-Pleurochrysis_carterae.AAC.1
MHVTTKAAAGGYSQQANVLNGKCARSPIILASVRNIRPVLCAIRLRLACYLLRLKEARVSDKAYLNYNTDTTAPRSGAVRYLCWDRKFCSNNARLSWRALAILNLYRDLPGGDHPDQVGNRLFIYDTTKCGQGSGRGCGGWTHLRGGSGSEALSAQAVSAMRTTGSQKLEERSASAPQERTRRKNKKNCKELCMRAQNSSALRRLRT